MNGSMGAECDTAALAEDRRRFQAATIAAANATMNAVLSLLAPSMPPIDLRYSHITGMTPGQTEAP